MTPTQNLNHTRFVLLLTLVTLIATALPARGDIFKYRDASGKLVISNQPPPADARVESQRSATTPAVPSHGAPRRDAAPAYRRPAPAAPLSYVDLNPIELQSSRVEDSEVYWKKFVTGVVKNRSGRTGADAVMVRTSCTLGGHPADTGMAYLGHIGPRGAAAFQIPIILDVQEYHVRGKGWFTPKLGRVSCQTRVTYDRQS